MHPVLEAALGFKFGNADSFAGDKGAGPMDQGEEDDDSDDDEGAVGAGEASKPKAAAPAAKAAPAPAKPKELSEEEKAAAAVAEVLLCARRRVEVGCMRGTIPNARPVRSFSLGPAQSRVGCLISSRACSLRACVLLACSLLACSLLACVLRCGPKATSTTRTRRGPRRSSATTTW
jgi:hypothetical protein